MTFHINLTSSAADDLDYFDAYEQRIIMAAVHSYLVHDAHIPTKRRKQLEANRSHRGNSRKTTIESFTISSVTQLIYSRLDTKIITICSFAEGECRYDYRTYAPL